MFIIEKSLLIVWNVYGMGVFNVFFVIVYNSRISRALFISLNMCIVKKLILGVERILGRGVFHVFLCPRLIKSCFYNIMFALCELQIHFDLAYNRIKYLNPYILRAFVLFIISIKLFLRCLYTFPMQTTIAIWRDIQTISNTITTIITIATITTTTTTVTTITITITTITNTSTATTTTTTFIITFTTILLYYFYYYFYYYLYHYFYYYYFYYYYCYYHYYYY